MVLQFLQAYAELVAAMKAVGGPQHNDLTGNPEKDGCSVAGWLHHLELNLQHYAKERPAVHVAAVALTDAWRVWGVDDKVARQALWEMFLDTLRIYYQLSGCDAKSCTLTESQALLMYKRGLLDCGATSPTYAAWKAAGKVFGIDFSISTGFSLEG